MCQHCFFFKGQIWCVKLYFRNHVEQSTVSSWVNGHLRWTKGSILPHIAWNQHSTLSLFPAWFSLCNSQPLGQVSGSPLRLFGRSHTFVVCKHVPVWVCTPAQVDANIHTWGYVALHICIYSIGVCKTYVHGVNVHPCVSLILTSFRMIIVSLTISTAATLTFLLCC